MGLSESGQALRQTRIDQVAGDRPHQAPPPTPLVEEDVASLVLRYREGDTGALAALHDVLEPSIRGMLGRYRASELPGPVTAQDLSQQAWIILAELALRWRPGARFLAYFFRSFPLEIRRYVFGLRPRRPVQVVTVPHDKLLAQIEGSVPVPLRDELSWAEATDGLPPLERAAVLLRLQQRWSFVAIGRALAVSQSSAHRLYGRALARMVALEGLARGPGAPSLERVVRSLHNRAGSEGALPGRRRVLGTAGLSRPEYEGLLTQLESAGAVVERSPRRSGRLADHPDPAATLQRLAAFQRSHPPAHFDSPESPSPPLGERGG